MSLTQNWDVFVTSPEFCCVSCFWSEWSLTEILPILVLYRQFEHYFLLYKTTALNVICAWANEENVELVPSNEDTAKVKLDLVKLILNLFSLILWNHNGLCLKKLIIVAKFDWVDYLMKNFMAFETFWRKISRNSAIRFPINFLFIHEFFVKITSFQILVCNMQ